MRWSVLNVYVKVSKAMDSVLRAGDVTVRGLSEASGSARGAIGVMLT